MMKPIVGHRFWICLVALTTLLALVSCGGSTSSDSSTTVTEVVVVPSISSLQVRGQQKFTATALNSSGNAITSAEFTWSSTNTDVATIDENGIVTAKAGGTTKITATDTSESITSDQATLTVMPEIGAVTISPVNATIKVGERQQFIAKATDTKGNSVDSAVFQWAISYSGVASINADGVVTGISGGTVLVSASTGGVTSPIATLNVTN